MAAGAKISIKVITVAIGIPVGIATRKVVERTWEAARPGEGPRKPTEEGVQWGDAIAWGALSAVGIVIADLLTRRSAEAAYQALTGNPPPPGKPSKAHKKLSKASEKSPATDD